MSSSEPASNPVPTPEPVTFDVDDLDADEDVLIDFYQQVGDTNMLLSLAEHHTANGVHGYFVLFDQAVTFGHPGTAAYRAVHLRRDLEQRTFAFEHAVLPLPALAQSWLIHRGCRPDAITLHPDLGPPAADEATRALEQRLAGDGDHYAMGYSYTRDDPEDMVTIVVLRALDAHVPSPFRVVVEEVDTDAWTRTLREGGFPSVGEALQWGEDRLAGAAGPLPPVGRPTVSTRPAVVPTLPPERGPGRLF
ncbi:hypothetical protein [Streptomyces sp. NPDC056785]|uniref:hypothetical protein n=1 Tax=Streptomyces sp. NPDC056785 TaxID=3345944 RepID=UPI0036B7BEC5